MTDLLVARLLPAMTFGLAAGGLLWLFNLARKRAALTCALMIAAAYLPARWDGALLVAAQLGAVALASRLIGSGARLRLRDVVALTVPGVIAAWGLLTAVWLAYWSAAMVGGLAGAAAAAAGLAASRRFAGVRLRLITLTASDAGRFNGPGIVAGLAIALTVVAFATGRGILGPGEPALVLSGAAFGVVCGDALARRAPGTVLLGGVAACAGAVALVAYLP